jgi:MoaA/NifB/PqqE/SkfB family radical SAM enzyme
MKARFQEWANRFFTPVQPLPPGISHWQSPPDAPQQHRLHLRIEPNGQGILILNASTILHLNQTATEYAYYLIQGLSPEEVARKFAQRYRISKRQALSDYKDFLARIEAILNTPDLDPVLFLDLERRMPHSSELSAPLRLDCALTYRSGDEEIRHVAPLERVTRELIYEEWRLCLQKAWQAGIPHVVFTGGEPTLRPDLPDLIGFAESIGMVTGLLTSGLRLVEKDFLARILNNGLDHVMIVLDPVNDISWEAIRDTLASDIALTVHLTVSEQNALQIPDLVERLARMGVRNVSLSATHSTLSETLKNARDKVAYLGMRLVWDLPVPYSHLNPVSIETKEENKLISGAGSSWLYVEPDGDVLPYQGSALVLGNLLRDPWEIIWENARKHTS